MNQMKLTKETLKRIIKEELGKVLHEEQADYQDGIEDAMKELERNSYSTAGFEEKAMSLMGSSSPVEFEFDSVETVYDGVEPGKATFTIALTPDGKYTISGDTLNASTIQ